MKKSLIHKTLFIIFFMMMVIASAVAQDAVCLLESTHKYQVTLKNNNTYLWKVYTVNQWDDIKDAKLAPKTNYKFISNPDTNFVNIQFLLEGRYYVIVEENNPSLCSTRRAFAIEVKYGIASTEFQYIKSTDCSDDDNSYSTALLSYSEAGVELPESHYPLSVNYTIDGTNTKTTKVYYEDKLLKIEGIVEDKTKETINKIQIISATNKYGGKLFISTDKNIHNRKIFKKPSISKIKF